MPVGPSEQYIAKVTLNNKTLMDVTDKTVSEENLLSGYTALANDGYPITGLLVQTPAENNQALTVTPTTQQQVFHGEEEQIKHVSLITSFSTLSPTLASDQYYVCKYQEFSNGGYVLAYEQWDKIFLTDDGVTINDTRNNGNIYTLYPDKYKGYRVALDDYRLTIYESAGNYMPVTVNAITAGTQGIPTISIGSLSRGERIVSSSVTNTEGYISGGTLNANDIALSAYDFVAGNHDVITENGNYDVTDLETIDVNVSGGGGGTQAKEKLINFIDYDGTIVESYTAAEWSNVSALPSNPSHSGLVAQGWNWTKAQIDSYHTSYPNGIVWVGQMYITSSGATEIDITLDDPEYLSPYLTIAVNGTVTVDWGDNTATSTVTGTSNTSLQQYTLHEYANTGSYTIKLTVESGTLSIFSNSNGKSSILSVYGQDSNRRSSRRYSSKITAIRLGENALIGANAFVKCIRCKTITIPSSITSIGTYAFMDCYSLVSLTISSSVTSIGTTTFQNCYSLASLTLPSSITTIGTYAFSNCKSLTSLTIPNGVTSIGNSVFQYCYSLTSLTIPSSATSIGTYVFSNCYSLTSLTILSSITSIGNYTCQNCYSLTSLTIPSGITTIGNYAFTNCQSLTSLTIPSGITTIGTNVFSSCYSLINLTIPSSVTSIGASAFSGSVAIEEYHFLPTTPPTGGTTMFSNIVTGTKIYVPYSADHSVLEAYKTATNWSTYASYMEEEPQ